MASRLVFFLNNDSSESLIGEELTDFQYYSGFAISQKRKSIESLHESFQIKYPDSRVLEISTKSDQVLGVKLSAFNLRFRDEGSGEFYHLENVFQSSKVYENGGPYLDMLKLSPADAKRDTRHHTSGELIRFQLKEWDCPLEPKTMFYDWIYCKALSQNPILVEALIAEGYNAFTDIEFNHNRSINCQARAATLFVSLYRKGIIHEYLDNKAKWASIYAPVSVEQKSEQIKFEFDY